MTLAFEVHMVNDGLKKTERGAGKQKERERELATGGDGESGVSKQGHVGGS